MSDFDIDLFVIGAGSGGVRAARIAAGYGARVAIAEEYRYGGTCVIRGCVPKKLLMYASALGKEFAQAQGFGWDALEPRHSWPSLIAAKDQEVQRLEAIYRSLLEQIGVRLFNGRATLGSGSTIRIDGRTIRAKTILIATGGIPVKPGIPGAELMITSNEAFHLRSAPRRIAILGGGYIACEFAGIFNGLGSQVIQLHRGQRVLRGFDEDVRSHLTEEIRKSGVDLRCATDALAVEQKEGHLTVQLTTGGFIEVDEVMAATGRRPNTSQLGLEAAGVRTDAEGAIKVNEYSQTSNPDIYAVGDVTNRMNLTPVALSEGHAFADSLFGDRMRRTDHSDVPFAVFSQPPVASVGLTETQASEQRLAVDIYKSTFKPMRSALSRSHEKILVKLVVDSFSGRVLGAHMVGADAAEVVQGIAIAIKAKATKADFDATLGIHPTVAEEFVTLRAKSHSLV